MQAARQSAEQATQKTKSSRSRMISAIHLQWKKARPDLLQHSHESRDERLAFISDLLKLKRPLESMRSLSEQQLGLVLDALKHGRIQQRLPHSQAEPGPNGAEIIHLASAEQVFTINKLLDCLGWGEEARAKFIEQRFKRNNPSMLTPKQAHALVMILLNIAAARAVKGRTGASRITRQMIHEEIPQLKSRLGIDLHKNSEEGQS